MLCSACVWHERRFATTPGFQLQDAVSQMYGMAFFRVLEEEKDKDR